MKIEEENIWNRFTVQRPRPTCDVDYYVCDITDLHRYKRIIPHACGRNYILFPAHESEFILYNDEFRKVEIQENRFSGLLGIGETSRWVIEDKLGSLYVNNFSHIWIYDGGTYIVAIMDRPTIEVDLSEKVSFMSKENLDKWFLPSGVTAKDINDTGFIYAPYIHGTLTDVISSSSNVIEGYSDKL